ncbi:hypothetical protein BD413DRAFT_34481 [Trametes elegans]|nr:hypothetical protein BD413DRAFT_34481 [Trametes elegans]
MIKTAGQDSTGAAILFLGCPCASRTGSRVMILKDSVDPDRHSNQARLSPNMHAEGDFPGVIRLVSAEDVKYNGRDIDFTSGDSDKTRPKGRLAPANTGLGLEYAESVNDLLMSIYDALEVHRELARRRHMLHRDVSVSNILMYPKRRSALKQANRLESFPPLIDDILAGEQRVPEEREPRCLLINHDHAAKLLDDVGDMGVPKELRYRTVRGCLACHAAPHVRCCDGLSQGTAIYIARAVPASVVFCRGRVEYRRMPLLSAKAEALYVKLHGEDRYGKYNDDACTALLRVCAAGRTSRPAADDCQGPPFLSSLGVRH